MLRRDLILVQIEELGKAIAQLIDNRLNGNARKTDQLLNTIYTSLKVEKDDLLIHPAEELHLMLNGEDGEGLQRLEIAAKTLIEESYLSSGTQSELQKAKEILMYLQEHDKTFSFERINLLEEIQNRLDDLNVI